MFKNGMRPVHPTYDLRKAEIEKGDAISHEVARVVGYA